MGLLMLPIVLDTFGLVDSMRFAQIEQRARCDADDQLVLDGIGHGCNAVIRLKPKNRCGSGHSGVRFGPHICLHDMPNGGIDDDAR